MNELVNEIKGSRTHKLVLGATIALTMLAAVWKFTPANDTHVSARQLAVESAVKGF